MSVTLMFMLRNASKLAEAEEERNRQKYGREPKIIFPRVKKVVKPNQTTKLTMTIPKFNDYDYSVLDDFVWLDLQKTKIRKVVKPNGSYHFIVAPATKKSNIPTLKINAAGDVFVHKKNKIMQYNHSNLPLFYEDIVRSVKRLNKKLFPITEAEKEVINNGKLLNRIGRFFGRLFKKG